MAIPGPGETAPDVPPAWFRIDPEGGPAIRIHVESAFTDR